MQNTIFMYDVYAYLTLLKNTLTIERQISINNNKLDKFEQFSIVYGQLNIDCIMFDVFVTKSNINCKYR